MKKYIVHWFNGKTDEIEGTSQEDACRRAGYGLLAIPAMSWIEEKKEDTKE